MKSKFTAGQVRNAARVITRNGVEARVSEGVAISDDALALLAEISVDRDKSAMVEMPLAAVSIMCHALAYLHNNPKLDGVLKIEADAAYSVMVFIADEMHPGAAGAFAQIDADLAKEVYRERKE